MAKGGFPQMGGGNMKNMMKQMQNLQKQMEQMQAELDAKEFEATAGGGVVTAKVNGKKELLSIKIDMKECDGEDIEMLQDMIVASVNAAMKQADEASAGQIGKLTGGMNIPGLF